MMKLRIALFLFLLPLLASCAPKEVSLKNTHVHGLAVDRGDSNHLYLATHNGLFTLSGVEGFVSTADLDRSLVGSSRDDFMGFSPHPTDPNILFSSGHPKGGGNLGFRKSEDAGKSWVKVSNANPAGPVDFHSMTVHPANPDHVYGWYKLRVHRSLDQGQTWEILPRQPPEILTLAGDPGNENVLYLGTIGGLLRSSDRGETWTSVSDELTSDVVFDIEADPTTGTLLLATRDHGIVRITKGVEGGTTTETIGRLPQSDVPEHLALDPTNAQTVYAFGKSHTIYKSVDAGQNWQKLL